MSAFTPLDFEVLGLHAGHGGFVSHDAGGGSVVGGGQMYEPSTGAALSPTVPTGGAPIAPGPVTQTTTNPPPTGGAPATPAGPGVLAGGPPVTIAGKQYPAGTVTNPSGVPMSTGDLPGGVGTYQGPPTSQSPYSAGGGFQSVGGIRINNPYSDSASQAYGSPQAAAAAMGINLGNWTPEGNYVGPVDASGMPTAVGGHYVGPSDYAISQMLGRPI